MVNDMNSRMERYNSNYDSDETTVLPSRVSKNNNLYQDIKNSELSRVRSNDNVKVLESSGKTINIDKIRRYIEENSEKPRTRRPNVTIKEEPKVIEEESPSTPKVYDINSVLEKAKQSREIDYDKERYKKLHDTQYDILSKLEMYNEKEEPKEELTREDFNTEEKTLIDLINTVTIHKGDLNLLDELMGGEGEEKTLPIEEEKEKTDIKEQIEEIKKQEDTSNDLLDRSGTLTSPINLEEIEKTRELVNLKNKKIEADNSFYTNSMTFSKEDFEGFEELEKSVKKNSTFTIILIIAFIILVVASLVVIANYVFKLGLF